MIHRTNIKQEKQPSEIKQMDMMREYPKTRQLYWDILSYSRKYRTEVAKEA